MLQVSTWFANARRRLKKENKLQWSTTAAGGELHDRKSRDDNDDDVDDDVSADYNDVGDYDAAGDDGALDRRQMALGVPRRAADIASRLGK